MAHQHDAVAVEPYKLHELFSMKPEYDGNQIISNTFINSCTTAMLQFVPNEKIVVVLHIKN